MNIFSKLEDTNVYVESMLGEIKSAAIETTKTGTDNQTRGSPASTEGKASRDNEANSASKYSSDQYDNGNKVVISSSNRPGVDYQLRIGSYSLKEIADIYKRGKLGGEYDVLFEHLFDYCKNSGIIFSVVPEVRNNEGNRIPGMARGNKIFLDRGIFNGTKYSNKKKSDVILHEMIHTATVYATRAYGLAVRDGAVNELPKNIQKIGKDIFKVYASIKDDPLFKDEYGIKNPEEMVACITKPDFALKLKASYTSAWHKLLEAICELLGINKKFSNYDKLTKALDSLLTHPDYALAKEYYSVLNQNPYYLDESQYEDASKSGKASRELDFIDYLNEEVDDDLARAHTKADESMMNRLHLINALESITEYPSERGILNDYRAMVETIAGSEKRIADIDADIKALSKNSEANAQVIKMLRAEKNILENQIHKADERYILNKFYRLGCKSGMYIV